MTHIFSVSLNETEAYFIKNQKGNNYGSPTWLIKRAIHDAMAQSGDILPTYKELQQRHQSTLRRFQDMNVFIKAHGLEEDYFKTLEEKHGA